MKKISLLILILVNGSLLIAQSSFEGILKYEIIYENVAEGAKTAISMQPTSTTIEIRNGISRTIVPNQLGGETTVIQQMSTGKTITLINIMGMKYAVRSVVDLEATEKLKFKNTDQTKNILGYTSKKAIIEENGNTVEIFYTEELKTNLGLSLELGIKGTPLEIKVIQQSDPELYYTMIQKVVEIDKKVIDEIKMIIPSDFEEVTQEELRQKMGGM